MADGFLGALVWVAAIVSIGAPPVLAFASDQKARSFQDVAFGHLARMAQRVRFMIWMVLAYHILVLIHGVIRGTITDLFQLPISDSGLALYGRILVGLSLYALMWGIVVSMHNITQPDPHEQKRVMQE